MGTRTRNLTTEHFRGGRRRFLTALQALHTPIRVLTYCIANATKDTLHTRVSARLPDPVFRGARRRQLRAQHLLHNDAQRQQAPRIHEVPHLQAGGFGLSHADSHLRVSPQTPTCP